MATRFTKAAVVTLGVLAGLVATAGAGCSSSSSSSDAGGKVCTFFADAKNCWITTFHAIDECLGTNSDAGGEKEVGTFSSNKLSCQYPSGKSVEFDAVVDTTVSTDKRHRSFTLRNGAKNCGQVVMGLEGSPQVMEMTGPDGVKVSYQGDKTNGAMTYTCGNGATFKGTILDLGSAECSGHFFAQAGVLFIGGAVGAGADNAYVVGSSSVGYACQP